MLHLRPQEGAGGRGFTLVGVPLLLLATWSPQPILVAGVVAAAMVATNVILDARDIPVGQSRSR